jgi:insulysin
MATMFVEIVSELCNEFSYAASMAGLHCGFRESLTNCGCIELTISGYNHKCHTLLHRICDTIQRKLPTVLTPNPTNDDGISSSATPNITNQFFERIRNKVEQRYESTLVAQPYQHGSMIADLILDATNYGSVHDKLSYIRNKTLLTCQDMLQFSKQVLSCFHLEILVHGNVLPHDAVNWTNIILDTFQPTPPSRLMIGRGIVLPDSGVTTLFRDKGWNEHDENSCIVNIYQIGIVDIPLNAKMSLLLQLLREPAFNMLRTEEQLGYIVFTSVKTIADNVKGLMFLIQSDSYDPIHLNERIEHFLLHFRNTILMEMSEEDFMTNVSSLCDSMLEKSKNLSEETMKHWNVIQNRTYYFQRINDIVNVIRTLHKIDIIRLFDHYVLTSSPHRRKLSIQLFGTAHESVRQELISTSKSSEKVDVGTANEIVIDQSALDDYIRSRPLYPTQKVGSIEDYMMSWIVEE